MKFFSKSVYFFFLILFLAFVNPTYLAAQTFSPTVSVSLSNTDCNDLSDLTIIVSQDAAEVDMSTSLFASDAGSFDISNMSIGANIGSAVMSAGAGFYTFNTNLIVSSITSNQVVVQAQDITTGMVLGTFTITNSSTGVSISTQSVSDGNNFTAGNSQTITFTNVFVTPGAGALTFTTTIDSELGDQDIQNFSFTIACLDFSPTVSVSLSNTDCNDLSDLTIIVSQDAAEVDMSTSLFASDAGSFDISNMSIGANIGSAVMSAGAGFYTFNTNLIVSSITSNQVVVQAQDITTGMVLGTFTITNSSTGVSISTQSVSDGNNFTAGNSQTITFTNVFVTPGAGALTFTTTIDSELGDQDIQNFSFTIACLDFSPTVSVSLSNTDCNDLSDLTIIVSQDAAEVDMSTSLFASDAGSFDISNMSIGANIGSAVMSAGAGFYTFNTNLIVSSITSNQVVVQAQDITTGMVLGTFTITNSSTGVSISTQSVSDGNNFTAGNSQTITFTNVFVTPGAGALTFTTTIDSELGDQDIQNFSFTIACLDFSPTVSVSLSNTDCNDLSDLTIIVSQDAAEVDMSTSLFASDAGSFDISNMSIGANIGSAVMSAGAGFYTFNTNLIVSSITSNQVVVQAQDITTGMVLGTFTITNSSTGVSISTQSVSDGNNFTAGNSQTITFTNVFVTPGAGALTFTTTIDSELGDQDIQNFSFTIACLDFSPTVSVSLSNTDCNDLSDLTIIVSQDAAEVDMSTSLFASDAGSFDISNMSIGANIGSAVMSAGAGFYTFNTNLIVSSITSNQVVVQAQDITTGMVLGTFTITNSSTGVSISTQSVSDGNNFTAGNSQTITFTNVFVTPGAGALTFTTTIDSELGDQDIQNFSFTIACLDFSPTVSVSLSNTDCNDLSDLTIIVSQDAAEVDMSTSLFASDAGSFDISNMSIGANIGSAVMSAGAGFYTFNTNLIVSSITSNQVVVQAQDITTGMVLGTFTITNSSTGVSISTQSVSDGNNFTAGNSQTITFTNVFVTPGAGALTFTTTIDSELGDQDIQNFSFTIACLDFSPTVSVSFSNTDCNDLSDLTIIVSQDASEVDMSTSLFASDAGSFDISNMSIGANIGSAVMSAGAGFYTFNTNLIVSSITSNQVVVQAQDITTGMVLGTFTITNSSTGVSISTQSVSDGNNFTAGNSQTITFTNVFVTPGAGALTFTTTIDSELGDQDIQNFSFTIACLDFSPTVSVSLSNTDCNDLSDLTIIVSQDAAEVDMSTSLFASDAGSFDISNMSIGANIGSAVMSAGAGFYTFNTNLIVSSITSNQVVVQAQDITTGMVLGTFTITNSSTGVSISTQSVSDGNNFTAGNSQTITFTNVFVTPGAGALTFTTTIDSELGDQDIQNFSFTIACLNIYGCTDPTSFNYNVLANTDDGTCTPFVYGCMDSNQFNFNPNANTDDGSCIAVVNGCMDASACNYNAAANTSGNCTYAAANADCSGACLAGYTSDGETCVAIVTGCTDPTATNYNAAANTDDGSCTYTPLCLQLGDANCDGIVNLPDLVLVINNWLQSTPVGDNGDVVGSMDGFVNLDDLVLVINNWLQSTP